MHAIVPVSAARIKGIALLVCVCASMLAACGGGSSSTAASGPVDLTYWSLNVDMSASIALFEQSHPNITVRQQKFPSDGYYAKLQTAIKAGNAPDAVRIEYQFLPTIETTGGLVDLAKYGANDLKSKFVSWTWSQVSRGNAVYAIPEDTGPVAMYYRADVFKKYNIQPPTTWAEYADAAAKLHAANPNAYITDFPPGEPSWFAALAWQGGGRWFGINGNAWKVSLNDDGTKKVASYWQGLVDKKLVETVPDFSDAWNADLTSGNIATWISAVWGTGFLSSAAPKSSGDWQVAPLPQWNAGDNASANWGGSTTAVTTNSKHPKEAAEFAQFLDGDSQSVAAIIKNVGLYPALQSGLDDATFAQPQPFYNNQVLYPIFKDASQHVDVSFQWGPTMTQVYSTISDAFGSAADGKTTLPAALDTIQTNTVSDMKSQGFTVQP